MKKLFSCLIGTGVLMAVVGILIITQFYRFWLQAPSGDIDPILFEIESGASLSEVALTLEAQDLIASDFWFRIYTRLDGSAGLLRAGVYQLEPSMSYASLVDLMTEYTAGADISITIPEGCALDQIGEVVVATFEITKEDWEHWTGMESPLERHEFVIQAQKPDHVDLEGYLFPDTYRFYPDATAEQIATTLLEEMQKNIKGIDYIQSFDSIHEWLTLASIIEKEVPTSSDMKLVSGVFQNRLLTNMAMQSCATVNYITGKDDPAVSSDDLAIDSLYNTYMYPGLPPGPIASPGSLAIEAAIHPTASDYYYFLATREGETIYATTFEEHVANKAMYLY